MTQAASRTYTDVALRTPMPFSPAHMAERRRIREQNKAMQNSDRALRQQDIMQAGGTLERAMAVPPVPASTQAMKKVASPYGALAAGGLLGGGAAAAWDLENYGTPETATTAGLLGAGVGAGAAAALRAAARRNPRTVAALGAAGLGTGLLARYLGARDGVGPGPPLRKDADPHKVDLSVNWGNPPTYRSRG